MPEKKTFGKGRIDEEPKVPNGTLSERNPPKNFPRKSLNSLESMEDSQNSRKTKKASKQMNPNEETNLGLTMDYPKMRTLLEKLETR